ncbi:MAG: VWA domain-containing protein [SAR202 cluster bacterium]|nr:VWA domain-containing protein [SAR202 cluster bacterium]
MTTYRYSKWDGSQEISGLNEDELLDALSHDILEHGDVDRALRDMFQRGVRDRQNDRQVNGLRDLMERLKEQRREQLSQHNMGKMMDEIKERLQDVVETERQGIQRRLQVAREQLKGDPKQAESMKGPMKFLEDRAKKANEALDNLPDSTAGAIRELSDYDFMDPEAHRKFQELMDMLKQHMMEQFLDRMRQELEEITPQQIEDLKKMTRALNQMLRDRSNGKDPKFDEFMKEFGDYFDPNRAGSLDELIQRMQAQMSAMQALLRSMSPQQRGELDQMTAPGIDPELMQELSDLAGQVLSLLPLSEAARDFPPYESVAMEEAMDLMDSLESIDELEKQISRAIRNGDVSAIDPDLVEETLGEDARKQLEQLQQVLKQLQESGYLKDENGKLELTARGIRKVAQQALKEVFSELKKDRAGQHQLYQRGASGEATAETKQYEYGDPFDLDLVRTVFNAVTREGGDLPVHITPPDMEINRTEHVTQAATVLLVDQSRSMGLMGNFAAARKVALALFWLIQSKFPRDHFYVIGFSDYAIEVKGEELPKLTWNTYGAGTNMHHAFMLSRKLLSNYKGATRQILMITDGEPTAHLEEDRAYFSYPPSYKTIDETLKEVKRCTEADIKINTFMLESNPYLVDFVDKMTKINQGRAFYTTADKLGQYVMVDYLNSSKRVLR